MSSSAPGGSAPDALARRRAWPVLAILALCAAPVVAAWLAYFVWPPASRSNYGELIEPRPLPDPQLERSAGGAIRLSALHGKWLLVQLDRADCREACREKLLYMRQARLTQGRDMDRIERVWLVTDDAPIDPALLREFEGTHVLRAGASGLPREFPAARDPTDHIYVVDPLGNLMLRYPRDPDPNGIKRDLARLLRASRIG
jgi:cytochrome oxidase Cu insertion factor (SCO1/SenC/PrrC family)